MIWQARTQRPAGHASLARHVRPRIGPAPPTKPAGDAIVTKAARPRHGFARRNAADRRPWPFVDRISRHSSEEQKE